MSVKIVRNTPIRLYEEDGSFYRGVVADVGDSTVLVDYADFVMNHDITDFVEMYELHSVIICTAKKGEITADYR